MRDRTTTTDDLEIAAAKEKLATLGRRPGYAEAMNPVPIDTRGFSTAVLCLALVFGALAVVCGLFVGALWLRLVLVILFAILTFMMSMAAIGSRRERPPIAWAVVVLGKSINPDRAGSPDHRLSLLRADGETLDVSTLESVHNRVRAGDVGVAHVRSAATIDLVIEIVRL